MDAGAEVSMDALEDYSTKKAKVNVYSESMYADSKGSLKSQKFRVLGDDANYEPDQNVGQKIEDAQGL